MASEWATSKAIKVWPESQWYLRLGRDGDIERLAAALDEARREGAERERWECHRIASDFSDRLGGTSGAVAIRLAARGPMRGPEEE